MDGDFMPRKFEYKRSVKSYVDGRNEVTYLMSENRKAVEMILNTGRILKFKPEKCVITTKPILVKDYHAERKIALSKQRSQKMETTN